MKDSAGLGSRPTTTTQHKAKVVVSGKFRAVRGQMYSQQQAPQVR